MPGKKTNKVLHIVRGVAYVDVATRRCPDAVAKIDVADLPMMLDGQTGWCAVKLKKASSTMYVLRRVGGRHAARTQLLHRVILGLCDPKIQGDHRNGDGLDNRRANLRPATNAQNSRNGRKHVDAMTSRFKGVAWDKDRNCWQAGIGVDSKRLALGRFKSEVAAARAYDKAALQHHGAFAKFNFPIGGGNNVK